MIKLSMGPSNCLFWQTDSSPLSVAYYMHKHLQGEPPNLPSHGQAFFCKSLFFPPSNYFSFLTLYVIYKKLVEGPSKIDLGARSGF